MTGFIIAIFFFWRIGLFLIAYFGSKFLQFSPSFPYSDIWLLPSKLPFWFWGFANFDGVHYLTIAKTGYSANFTQVFFPFYPFLINLIHEILPFLDLITIGILLSSLLFLVSLFMLFKLLRLDYQDKTVKWFLAFLVLFPTSFYFGSLYTESLFLVLIIGTYYFARRKNWWLAGIFGGLASATRLIGIFLLPALLWEWYTQNKFKIKNFLNCPPLYLIPLGLISYMIYLQWRFGDALLFWHVQPVFGAERSGSTLITPFQVLWRYFKIITSVPSAQYQWWTAVYELAGFLMAVFCLIKAHLKKVRLSYLIFAWLALIIPVLTGTFSSIQRYILIIFPIYLALALIKTKWFKILILFLFAGLLIVSTVLFTNGFWVS
ncbi:hypothetical protein MUP32_02880 [Candidatus Microgenomates bacterium]|nr:hypothetical protein [Candidatus Microgenomates bacterium]